MDTFSYFGDNHINPIQCVLTIQNLAEKLSRIDERSGKSEKTGKDWFIRTQEAYIDLGGQFPVQIKVPLQKDQVPYGPGHYVIHPKSFKTSAYFDLQVGDVILVPVDEKMLEK